MKKKIGIGALLIAFAICATSTVTMSFKSSEENSSYCKHGQCVKIKKDGYQCESCAQSGSSYCWSHNN